MIKRSTVFSQSPSYMKHQKSASGTGGMYRRVRQVNLYTFKIACHFSCINTTETCNTAMEREFCGLFGVSFKNFEKCSYEALFALFWQVLESAYADLNSNIKILGQYVLKPLILVYCNSNIAFWANSIVL